MGRFRVGVRLREDVRVRRELGLNLLVFEARRFARDITRDKNRAIIFDNSELVALDKQWQLYIKERIKIDFGKRKRYSLPDQNKAWWWQIDVIDMLDPEQLKRI